MHFSVLLIHEDDDISSVMKKYHFDASDSSGAKMEFEVEYTKDEIQKEFESYLQDFPDATFEEFIDNEYSHLNKNENGDYGYNSNSLGLYDWYEVGGRWEKSLPTDKSEKELKALVNKALDGFRKQNDLLKFAKVSEMSLTQACAYLSLDGRNTISIGECSFEELLSWWDGCLKNWENRADNLIQCMFSNIIIETNEDNLLLKGESKEMNVEFLREKYEYYKKVNLENPNRAVFMSVLDLHS
jgi:hypothetical protein